MGHDPVMLTRPPLIEAIFEVKWALRTNPQGFQIDPIYEYLPVALAGRLKERFPLHVPLVQSQGPWANMQIPYQVQHQFRVQPDKFPIIQVGPGVFTHNQAVGYDPQQFQSQCVDSYRTLIAIFDQHPDKRGPIADVSIRFVNSIPLDGEPLSVVASRLGIRVEVAERFFRSGNLGPMLDSAGLDVSFVCSDPVGCCGVIVSPGNVGGKAVLLWQVLVVSRGEDVRLFVDNPERWIGSAHDRAHEIFMNLIQGELYERFK